MTRGEQTQNSAPLYQTNLEQDSLPQILVKIHHYKVPGVIECRRGDETKRIYLDDGQIIFATTNQVIESLGDRLIRSGRLTQEQYDESVRIMKVTGMRAGVTLINMGLLTKEELFTVVRQQLQEIIDSIFEWTTGAVSFTPGRDRDKALEFVKLEISIPDAILRGVRRMSDAKSLIARIGPKTTLLEKSGKTIGGLHLSESEQRLLDSVNGKSTLYELVMSSPDAGSNARALYALFVLGLIVRRESRVKVQIKTETPVPNK